MSPFSELVMKRDIGAEPVVALGMSFYVLLDGRTPFEGVADAAFWIVFWSALAVLFLRCTIWFGSMVGREMSANQ